MIPKFRSAWKKNGREQEKNCLRLTAGFDCVCHNGKQVTILRGHGDEKKKTIFEIMVDRALHQRQTLT